MTYADVSRRYDPAKARRAEPHEFAAARILMLQIPARYPDAPFELYRRGDWIARQCGEGFARSIYLLEMFNKSPWPDFGASATYLCELAADGPFALADGEPIDIAWPYVQPVELMLAAIHLGFTPAERKRVASLQFEGLRWFLNLGSVKTEFGARRADILDLRSPNVPKALRVTLMAIERTARRPPPPRARWST